MNLGPKAPTSEGVPTPPVAPAPGGRDPRPSSRLGELLVRLGLVTPGQVGEAVNLQRTEHHSLVESLVKLGFIDGEAVVLHLQREYRLPRFDLETADPPEEVLRLVPEPLARNHLLIPIQRDGATLTVAVADPTNLAALDQVRFSTGCALRIVLASCRAIQTAIRAPLRRGEALLQRRARRARRREPLGRQTRQGDRHQEAPRGERGSADRQARLGDHGRRDLQARERHPHRAVREGGPRPVPHRRRALRHHVAAAALPRRARLAHQDPRLARHLGAPAAARRQHSHPARGGQGSELPRSPCCRRLGARRSSCEFSTRRRRRCRWRSSGSATRCCGA